MDLMRENRAWNRHQKCGRFSLPVSVSQPAKYLIMNCLHGMVVPNFVSQSLRYPMTDHDQYVKRLLQHKHLSHYIIV